MCYLTLLSYYDKILYKFTVSKTKRKGELFMIQFIRKNAFANSNKNQASSLEHEDEKRIPITAMTANVFREDIERCLKAGMNDYVGEPLDLDDVIGTPEKHLLPANQRTQEVNT